MSKQPTKAAASKTRTSPKSKQPSTPKPGRETNGRFAPGNEGGPGNPMARKVAAFRKALLESTTNEQIVEVAAKMRQQAIEGDVSAAKLFFAYTLGKPTPPPCDPDHVDQHEWMGYEAEVFLNNAINKFVDMPTPEIIMKLIRLLRATNADKMERSMFGYATASEKELEKYEKKSREASDAQAVEMMQNMGEAKRWEEMKAAAAAAADKAEAEKTAAAAEKAEAEKRAAAEKAKVAEVQSMSAPSPNGGNGVHRVEKPTATNGTAHANNGKKPAAQPGKPAKSPSPNGSNRVAAWLPKGKVKGRKIVPRF